MTSTLIDSNVLIDVLEGRPVWYDWALARMAELAESGPFVFNQISYGEASIPYDSELIFDEGFRGPWVVREDLPWSAAFRAGKAFKQYRERGGQKSSILPDFLIGAHAAVKGYRVLTRDQARYRTYFPEVEVIAPDTHP
jgi:predicted nucleic acid-binding protein